MEPCGAYSLQHLVSISHIGMEPQKHFVQALLLLMISINLSYRYGTLKGEQNMYWTLKVSISHIGMEPRRKHEHPCKASRINLSYRYGT